MALRRTRLACALGVLALVVLPVGVPTTQAFPTRPVTALVGFPPGGSTDLIARALEGVMKKHLGQPLVVVNRTGGVGTVAVTELVKARPDGYTVCVCPIGPLTTQPHLADLPYSDKDYLPIIHLAKFVGVLSVRSDAPWKTIQEFLAHVGETRWRRAVGFALASTAASYVLFALGLGVPLPRGVFPP